MPSEGNFDEMIFFVAGYDPHEARVVCTGCQFPPTWSQSR